MVRLINPLANLILCGSLYSAAQDYPKNEAHSSPTRRIVSVDGKASYGSEKWFSSYHKPELGTIASPEGGWLNRAHILGVDCEFAFQWIGMESFVEAKGIHDWMKFPKWSRVSVGKEKFDGFVVYSVGRGDLSNRVSDHIYVACDDQSRVVIIRLITLNHLKGRSRIDLVQNLLGLVGGNFKASSVELSKVGKSINASKFVVARDVPTTMAEATQRLIKVLTPVERDHLLKNIQDEPDLLDHWPTVDGEVNRLHWMTIYWGLNDPSSPLRRDIGKPKGLSNADYLLEVLKRVEKLLREKP
ncbi:hypothetical protein [Geothrix edaphica]|uniref:Uncharacterized protein n=1 Tax=Geothrix edaphica TaxID=2927976 RepID=A0ABQ5PZC1_9BACT|nr:hypothetical protein [Geothrix edaphica]GLH67737.1 hypothetical protein GETHED_21010 [Geothrix edaphica]